MKIKNILWSIAILGFIIGSIGVYQLITGGHTLANYNTYVPWGLWVSAYIYFIGLSAGAFFLSTLVYVFKIEILKPIGKLALFTALITLIAAILFIWSDLGQPSRAWRMMFKTNFGSMMGWMGWLYSFYFLLLITKIWFAIRTDLVVNANESGLKGKISKFLTFGRNENSIAAKEKDMRILKTLGIIGIPLAIAFNGGVGSLFGVIGARPVWNSGLTPIIFIAGGLASGGALLLFLSTVLKTVQDNKRRRKLISFLGFITLGSLLFYLVLEWAEYSVAFYASIPAHTESMKLVLFGDYWWVFWFVHLFAGALVPILLITLGRKSIVALGTAGALIAVTFISVRLNIVIPALAVEELEGLRNAFSGPGLTFDYFPSTMEWLFFIWIVSLAGCLFLLGLKLLPIINQKKVAQ